MKRPLDGQYYCAIILMLPLDGPHYCAILRTKNETEDETTMESGEQMMVYKAIIPTDDTIFSGYAIYFKSFNTINIIAQPFNLTYKHPILLCNNIVCLGAA